MRTDGKASLQRGAFPWRSNIIPLRRRDEVTAVKWLEVHIDTNHTGLEPVETMLSALGIDGVVIDDETEFEDFLENNGQYWDYVDEDLRQEMQGRSRITFYLEAGDEGFAKLGEVRIALEELKKTRDDCGTLLMTLDDLEDADWENNWKQYYKPMEIGDRLLVVPEWLREDLKVRAGLAGGWPWCWIRASPSAPAVMPPPACA